MELRLMNMETEVNDIRNEIKAKLKSGDKAGAKRLATKQVQITENMKQLEGCMAMMEEQKMMLDNTLQMRDVMSAIKSANCSIKSACNSLMVEDLEAMKDNMEDVKPDQEELNDFFKDYSGECENDEVNCILEQIGEEINEEAEAIPNMGLNKEQIKQKDQSLKDEEDLLKDFLYIDDDPKPREKKEEKKEIKKEVKKEDNKKKKEVIKIDKKENKEEEKDLKLDLKEKENVMKIINCQNFVEGFWDINDKTKIIKKKYENEFKLLKGLKGQKIDDIIAMTIIIIYFINKEHKELLEELVMILKKAKLYIQDKVGDSYENIINKVGIK